MARSEARIFTRIWKDEDFTDQPVEVQWLWFHLLSQADLSYCGVLPYMPYRWAEFAHVSVTKIVAATKRLVGRGQLVLDEKTSEVWVRTLVRNDGITNHPSLIRAMARDFTAILSPRIRDEFLDGLGEGFLEGIAEKFPKAFGAESRDGFPEPFAAAYRRRSPCVRARPSPLPTPHSIPPSPQDPSDTSTAADAEEPPTMEDDETRIGTATALVAERRLAKTDLSTIGNPRGWKRSVSDRLKAERRTDLLRWVQQGWSAERMADEIEPPEQRPPYHRPFSENPEHVWDIDDNGRAVRVEAT